VTSTPYLSKCATGTNIDNTDCGEKRNKVSCKRKNQMKERWEKRNERRGNLQQAKASNYLEIEKKEEVRVHN